MPAVSHSSSLVAGSLAEFGQDPLRTMRRLQTEQTGNIAILAEAGRRIIVGWGQEYNHRVLNDTHDLHSHFFAVRGPKHSAQRRLTCGLLSMNGEEHKRQRRLVHPPFQKKSLAGFRDLIVPLIEEQLREWRIGQVRNIHRDSVELLLRITSSLLFGVDHRQLSLAIGRATERWVELNHANGLGPLLDSARNNDRYDALLRQAEELELLLLQLIELRRKEGNPDAPDVLNLLLHAHDEAGGLTDEELVGQAAILFGAAHLTTANSLSWTLFLLAQHPAVGYALLDELTPALHGGAPELAQLEQLPLLDRIIRESMRCLPASAYSQRLCVNPTEVLGVEVRRGDLLIFSPFITHHLPTLYEQPEAFNPARWETLSVGPYEYLPFAAGPRMCMGAGMASMILRLTVPVIHQRYRLSVLPGAQIDGAVTSTMLGPKQGIPMLIGSPHTQLNNQWVRGNIHELVKLEWPDARRAAWPAAA